MLWKIPAMEKAFQRSASCPQGLQGKLQSCCRGPAEQTNQQSLRYEVSICAIIEVVTWTRHWRGGFVQECVQIVQGTFAPTLKCRKRNFLRRWQKATFCTEFRMPVQQQLSRTIFIEACKNRKLVTQRATRFGCLHLCLFDICFLQSSLITYARLATLFSGVVAQRQVEIYRLLKL